MITKDDIRNAYRFILGREVENDLALEPHFKHKSVQDLRKAFLSSDEFREKANPTLTIGRFTDQTVLDIEIDCSPQELEAMLTETAQTWSKFGEEAPHWSVLTHEKFTPENINANIDSFYASGVHNLDRALNTLKRAGMKSSGFERALDFGCGVGRLSMPLARMAKSVTSMDISPGHLKLAQERAVAEGVKNIEFVHLRDLRDLDKTSGYDFIISLIVLQHNPPPIMAYAFTRLLRALRPGGVAIIQMPTLKPERFSVKDYMAHKTGDMEMHALPQTAIFEIIERENCRPIEVSEDASIGAIGLSHRFTIVKRTAST
ncbi:class I SAM-dependent methyltransferase [Brevundimonas diminuta]|uniref:class I SAM-dependent methyltransferase n=1 Tax=Brevundimonas diminuta TaxID=293 RepID=UPI003CFD71BE